MSLNEEVDLLRQVPLFANVATSKLKLLAFASERMCFAPGQEICREGDAGDSAFVIIDGDADVVVSSSSGPITVAKLGRNAFVGEIAILTDVPRTATVHAITRVETLRIKKDLFFQLTEEFPQMAVELLRVLAQRLHDTTEDLSEARAALKAADISPD
jgi:CRP-like cAMP-binding protein